jgi:hypothetical protein
MKKVAQFSAKQRRELFSEAAARLRMTPAVVEKDFWVTWGKSYDYGLCSRSVSQFV